MIEGGASSLLRLASIRTVFDMMVTDRRLSRAELARRTGLSKQTTSEVIRHLEIAGWIRLCGTTRGPVGRRATTYELVGTNACVLGVDLGGTKVHVALADLFGEMLGEATEPTDPQGGQDIVFQIDRMMRAIAAKAGLDVARIHCGVLGSPGVVQPRTGRIHFAPNIPGLDTFDVADALSQRLGFSMDVENDVNLAAVGERSQGHRGKVGNLAFIALGTGIGMGIVANGQLLRGARGAAGEIAYLPLGGDPFDSRCFRLGTLETAIGAAAILDRYHAFGEAAAASDVRGIFAQLANGDPVAGGLIEEVVRLLAQAIQAVCAILDPEIVVLGGSIGSRPDILDGIRRNAMRLGGDGLPVETSLLGSRATLIGAISLAQEKLHRQLFMAARTGPEDAATDAVVSTTCSSGRSH